MPFHLLHLIAVCPVRACGNASRRGAKERHQEPLILFIAATGMNHVAAGITARRMRAMWVRGLIERADDGKYKLTASGRAAFTGILREAGFS